MKAAGYITFDEVKEESGAGKVCVHEINALSKVASMAALVTQRDLDLLKYKYQPNPFLYDYFAAQLLPENLDFLHLSCSPGLAILNKVRPQKYVVNIVAHDLSVSIEEHEKYYGAGSYPFIHNTDPHLHSLLLEHAKNATIILTPSTSSAKWIKENIRPDGIEVIHHGCDIPTSYISPPTDKLVVGYLGAFGPDKGLPYLYNAVFNMFNPYSNDRPSLLFGGSCSQFANIFPGVETTGWVDKVDDFYNRVSVYVQPSVTEGFGIEILEAMAFGRPVIATTGTAGPDVIRDGIDGFIVPSKDIFAIYEKLNYFKQFPNKIIEMGANARERAKEFTWDIVEQKYIKLYQSILGG